jgi:hypothetical protein
MAAACMSGALFAFSATAVQAASQADPNAQREDLWSTAIAHMPAPHEGCFQATFPSTSWKPVACVSAPNIPYIPRTGAGGVGQTVGDGNDYAAVVSGGLISQAVGSFPVVKGLKTESDEGRANTYSLQANSNFMSGSPACNGASNPANCLAWEQFVYSSSSDAAFMQYWLINWDTTCPSGWNSVSGDCYKNSSAVRVPLQVIKQLKIMKLTGAAVANGSDSLTLTTKTQAYNTTGADSVVFLANGWNATEFNVIGDGDGSEAVFNAGTKLTVGIALTDGLTTAPTCQSHDGTTGETNNLNLGSCGTSGGSTPSVSFVESLAK